MKGPVLLGAYAAKSCARATHNVHDPTIAEPPSVVPDTLQHLFDLGTAHEANVFDQALALAPDVVDLRGLEHDKHLHIDRTLEAMAARRQLILGGRLPDDPSGGRTGEPDLLVRDGQREDLGHGYHPGDVKAHRVLDQKRNGGLVGELGRPSRADASPAEKGLRHDLRDLLQLAHYWRMLEACGQAAIQPYGCIIGTDPAPQPLLAWYDLTEPLFVTFSRSRGKATRSSLERYDHEHTFRVRVAETARQQTDSAAGPEPLVEPLGQEECLTCLWAPVCVERLPASDLSRELLGALSVREYLALRQQGIHTVDQLAAADPDTLLGSGYADETSQQHARAGRLYKAHMSAALLRDGVTLRLKPDATLDLPKAPTEVDLDMECTRDGLVYLWGILVTRNDTSAYHAFGNPHVYDGDTEATVMNECFDWLRNNVLDAVVFHYAPVEKTHARRIIGTNTGRRGTVTDPDTWVDLLPATRDCLDSRAGHGLKVIATEGAGFRWRDEEPGGLQSQLWLDAATDGDTAAWQRILTYNEDDVLATLAVRRFLRSVAHPGPASPEPPGAADAHDR